MNVKRPKHRLLSTLLALVMVCSLTAGLKLPAAAYTSKSQNEAMDWVRSQVGYALDYDGVYGAQCVDLIYCYYQALGVPVSGGNGADFTWNALPSGWSRIQGAQPQPGDILVYTGGPGGYGHVAIYESDYVSYHQNFDNKQYVQRITYHYAGLSNPYWGVVRPDFVVSAPTASWDYNTCVPSDYDVTVKARANFDRKGWISTCGLRILDANGNLIKEYAEDANTSGSFNDIWYNSVHSECGVDFVPGTTYQYQFFTTLDGTRIDGPVMTFSTTGVTPLPPAPEPQPQLQHGWILDDYGWRYYGDNGKPVTDSWALDSQGWCYLGSDGYLKTNAWQLDSVGWCYLDDSGHVVTNSWKADSHGWVYLDGEGRMTRNAWVLDSQGWCYVGDDGYMVTNTWKMDSQGWCYLDSSGHIVTNSWKQDSHGWVYLDENGRMVYNCWQQDSSGWVWIGADGYAT